MFEKTLRGEIFSRALEKYGTKPEYLWQKFPNYAALRHRDNGKWYGLVMNVSAEKLGLPGEGVADILNVKLPDPLFRDLMLERDGIMPGYHIGRGNWVSVLLDGTVPLEEALELLDVSFRATASRDTLGKLRPAMAWLIPANPRYYDLEEAFAGSGVTDWKQYSAVKTGDTVYIYMAAPVSAVLYKCEVLETDIPYEYRDEHLSMSRVMKLKLLRRYDPARFPMGLLRTVHGVFSVRGPRGIPEGLLRELEAE